MSTQNNDLFEYDEDDAVKFIRKNNPQLALSDDEINYIIDLIYDYYESRGFFAEEAEPEVEIADDELITYVIQKSQKEAIYTLTEENIATVVQGELDYCDSLGIFED